MSLFEVKKDGKTYISTDSKDAIPEKNVLREMKKSGYKIYINGKLWRDK